LTLFLQMPSLRRQKFARTDFKGLRTLAELTGRHFQRGIVLYTGAEHIPFGSRLCALPLNALWTLNAAREKKAKK